MMLLVNIFVLDGVSSSSINLCIAGVRNRFVNIDSLLCNESWWNVVNIGGISILLMIWMMLVYEIIFAVTTTAVLLKRLFVFLLEILMYCELILDMFMFICKVGIFICFGKVFKIVDVLMGCSNCFGTRFVDKYDFKLIFCCVDVSCFLV